MSLLENGKVLDSAVIERGLMDLNPDIHFDMGVRLGQWHPFMETRQGVFYHGQHLVSMDRGQVPEFKMWTVKEVMAPAEWWEADQEGVSLAFDVVLPTEPGYRDMYEDAKKGTDNTLQIRSDGHLLRLVPRRFKKIRDRCVRVGWRHTFERLVMAGIPGVTRETVGEKFGVNMYLYPVGTPEEISEALVME